MTEEEKIIELFLTGAFKDIEEVKKSWAYSNFEEAMILKKFFEKFTEQIREIV